MARQQEEQQETRGTDAETRTPPLRATAHADGQGSTSDNKASSNSSTMERVDASGAARTPRRAASSHAATPSRSATSATRKPSARSGSPATPSTKPNGARKPTGKRAAANSAAPAKPSTLPPLRLYNTLTNQVEAFAPLEPGHVRMYSCGPTVYRFIHIGNLRTFAMADWLRRTLVALGLDVTHIKNITDVGHMRQERLDRGEDKLIAQARAEGKSPWEIAAFYTAAFHHDEDAMHILRAHTFPRATEHIQEMIDLTQTLLRKGYAYEAGGNVFFSVSSFPSYGELSGNVLEHLGSGEHTASENDPYKRAPEDFPLWKVAEEGRLMAWDSPWGMGFPGWHIECSAMSAKYLGPSFDIHTGGVDNIFPHHEDERAQSEAASGQQLAHMWVHGQHLLVDGLKMAKSSGNAYTLSEIEARGFEPMALRYLFTSAKYRTRINFTFRALRGAQTGLRRLRRLVWGLARAADGHDVNPSEVGAHPYYRRFFDALTDDLNIPRAMAITWAMLRDETCAPELRIALLNEFDAVLGLGLADVAAAAGKTPASTINGAVPLEQVPEAVLRIARERAVARQEHEYAQADALREAVLASGYEVRDTRDGWYLVPGTEREALITASGDVPSRLETPDTHAFSVNLLARDSVDDLRRCIQSIATHAASQDIEIVVVDLGSTDETLPYLRSLQHAGKVGEVPVRVLLADHNLGFGAGRNASLRASEGRIVVLMDTSIEVKGDIWTPLAQALVDPTVGIVGPYGLVTDDLKEYSECTGADCDAIEGYLMALRRETLREVGPVYEKFRFYRLADVDWSLEAKKAGYRVVSLPDLPVLLVKHPHREWYSLSPEDQAAKSKKNFDIYWRRRHHSQSLLVRNYRPGQAAPWGHDHEIPLTSSPDPRYEHGPIPPRTRHTHEHKHWPDHSHSHAHTHETRPKWHGHGEQTHYVQGEE